MTSVGSSASSRISSRPVLHGDRCGGRADCEAPTETTKARRNAFMKAPHGRHPLGGNPLAEFKAVIADPKDGKSYKRDITGHYANALIGKKLGDDLDGLYVGLPGYKLQITGGSDKDGFPMRHDLPGPRRKGLLVSGGGGLHPGRPRTRQGKRVCAHRTAPDILQLNLKIVVRGPKSIEDAWQEQAR